MVRKGTPLAESGRLILRKGLLLSVLAAAIVTVSAGGCASKSESSGEGTKAAQAMTAPDTKESAEAPLNSSLGNGETVPSKAGASRRMAGGDNTQEKPGEGSLEANSGEAGLNAEKETLAGKTDRRKEIEAFAERVQEAVADRDLESIADLTAFPLKLLTTDGEALHFKDRNEFLKQNPDMIFGDDLMVVVANIDTGTLEIKEDGVTMGTAEGPHIRYGMGTNGSFGIVDIQE